MVCVPPSFLRWMLGLQCVVRRSLIERSSRAVPMKGINAGLLDTISFQCCYKRATPRSLPTLWLLGGVISLCPIVP